MSIRVGIGRGCQPDLRIQAFQFLAGAAADETIVTNIGFWRTLGRSLRCIGQVMGLAAVQALMPGVVPLFQKVVCISGLLSLLPIGNAHPEVSNEGELIPWQSFSVAQFIKEILEEMTTPVLITGTLNEIWTVFHPYSYRLAECSIALLEIDRHRRRLVKRIERGEIVGGAAIEAAWIAAHKMAARRVADLLEDLPDRPPLKAVVDFLESHSIEIGAALEGCLSPVGCLSREHGFSLLLGCVPTQPRTINERMRYRPRKARWRLGSMGSPNKCIQQRVTLCTEDPQPMPEITEFPLELELEALEDDFDKEQPLALYGRSDHLEQDRRLTVFQKFELSVRATKLVIAFMPFVVLGLILLVLAYVLDDRRTLSRQHRFLPPSTKRRQWANTMRTTAFEHLLQGCRDSGAAFIKWGQWSSAREDLFPVEFCEVLSALHDQAPVHSIKETRKEIQNAYGKSIEEIFDSFEYQPLASGSVAQVHRAMYRKKGRLIPVIVKVRHPNVGQQIHQDFQILKPLAAMASKMQSLKNLPLKESVSQFSNTMTAQTDFRVEAAHVQRFGENFEGAEDAVVIPKVVEELVSESVLVETYEEGTSVAHYMKSPSEANTKIVALGVDAYLKMLLKDNFVHTDLHPGNILVREAVGNDGENNLQIVLLDFGLAEELRPEIRKHFVSFLNAIGKGDGRTAAGHLLQWSQTQSCPDPSAFVADMQSFFASECNIHTVKGIDLDHVMKSVLRLARKHSVTIDSDYASLVIGVCIIVGFAHSLDPRVNLMDAAAPVLLMYALTGRVVGRLYG